jgi:hypothetical protein
MTFSRSGSHYEPVDGRDAAGAEVRWHMKVLQELPASPNSPLTAQLVELENSTRLLRKGLPGDPQPANAKELAERLLDNEIRALTRLSARYPGADYPAELARLIGFNFDAVSPFVLVRQFVGPYADERLRTLLTDRRRMFMVCLFRALAQLAAVDLVHGAVGLPSLCWDGTNAQLVNFEHTVATGEFSRSGVRTTGSGEVRHRPQRTPAHPGDDIREAGLVIYQVITGRTPQPGHVPDLAEQSEALRILLEGVFAADPSSRPTARTMLNRLSADNGLPTPIDVEASLRAGRQQFDRIRVGSREQDKAVEPPPEPDPPPMPWGDGPAGARAIPRRPAAPPPPNLRLLASVKKWLIGLGLLALVLFVLLLVLGMVNP